jgi:hypothetical protein
MAKAIREWVSTGTCTKHGEPRGWRLHAVEFVEGSPDGNLKRSACGMWKRWGLDLFVERKCVRCLRALGLACATCTGRGHVGSVRAGTWDLCSACLGNGEQRNTQSKED